MIHLEYIGTNYVGWQKQKDGFAIQEILEDCLQRLAGEKVEVIGSGRTDAGVHALDQVAHFNLSLKNYKGDTIKQALNYHLREWCRRRSLFLKNLMVKPQNRYLTHLYMAAEQDITIKSCIQVSDNFHARFSSHQKHYRYIIHNAPWPSALWQNRAWHIWETLDLDTMQQAANTLLGLHDFSSFRDSQCQASSPLKTLQKFHIYTEKDQLVIMETTAKSFLHHMVRNIVGTLVEVGKHRLDVKTFQAIRDARDRKKAGRNAPAHGLYLLRVDY
jgi:tRNA pseudouridine38-40 synthase